MIGLIIQSRILLVMKKKINNLVPAPQYIYKNIIYVYNFLTKIKIDSTKYEKKKFVVLESSIHKFILAARYTLQ